MTRTRATRSSGAARPFSRSDAPAPPGGTCSTHRPDRRRLRGALVVVLLPALTVLVALVTASSVDAEAATGAARQPVRSAGEAPLPAYQLPVPGAPVLRGFEAPPEPWAAGHRGVDLTVPVATDVRAPAGGVVAFAGLVAGRGVVTLRHDDGLLSSLEPVTASVAVGERLGLGRRLGTLAAGDHCAATSCLHWGVRTGPDAYVDPLMLVAPGEPPVLLPP